MYELKYSNEPFGYNVDIKGCFVGPEVQSKYDLIEEVTEKVMNIQLGKKYRNRKGEILTATTNPYDTDYPWRMMNGSQFYHVSNEGYFVSKESGSLLDIESEVEQEVMITEEQFMAWAQGKEFLTISGRIVTLAKVYKGLDFDWTCLPKWANYITLQDDGSWKWFSDKPTISENYDCWVTNNPDPSSHGYIPTSQLPSNVLGYWTNNCHKRP